jgi:hypothetical protein
VTVLLADLDPAAAQALVVLAAALAMLITRFTSYYFPKGFTRFDTGGRKRRRRRQRQPDDQEDTDEP